MCTPFMVVDMEEDIVIKQHIEAFDYVTRFKQADGQRALRILSDDGLRFIQGESPAAAIPGKSSLKRIVWMTDEWGSGGVGEW